MWLMLAFMSRGCMVAGLLMPTEWGIGPLLFLLGSIVVLPLLLALAWGVKCLFEWFRIRDCPAAATGHFRIIVLPLTLNNLECVTAALRWPSGR